MSDLSEILSNYSALQYRLRTHLEEVLTPERPESAGQETLSCFLARCSIRQSSASELSPVVINRHVGRHFSTRQAKTKQAKALRARLQLGRQMVEFLPDHRQQERQPVESLRVHLQ